LAMQTVTHPVTINVSYRGRTHAYTSDRADLMNDGTGSNFDIFLRRMRELLGFTEKQCLELEFRGTDGNWWALDTKETLDNALKQYPATPATIAARVKPKPLLSSPYLYLGLGVAALGAYVYYSRQNSPAASSVPVVQTVIAGVTAPLKR